MQTTAIIALYLGLAPLWMGRFPKLWMGVLFTLGALLGVVGVNL